GDCNSATSAGIVVPPTRVRRIAIFILSAPDDHLTASPDCRVTESRGRRVVINRRHPTIRARIISPPSIQIATEIIAAPDDHFSASPHSREILPTIWRVGLALG